MKAIINGANGRMGRIVAEMLGSENIAAGVDVTGDFLRKLDDFHGEADCVIDFSNHKAVGEILKFCTSRNIPVLIASTGHDDSERNLIHESSRNIPIFFSPNMSLGVAILSDLAARVANLFGDCDIEIIEAHHNQKLDVPSGTALALANAIKNAKPELEFNIGRHENAKRKSNEIGIHSLRYGSEVGTHEIIFSNGLETISLRHDAKDRALFAKGAIKAAEWLIAQKPGLYNMKDLIGN